MVWGGRLRPPFLLEYRRVAETINTERLGWDFERIFEIHPYCVGMVWGGRSRPLIFKNIAGWRK